MIPTMKGHLLMGDSQLVRFSGQILGYCPHQDSRTEKGHLQYGLCRRGQSVEELLAAVTAHEESISKLGKAIILIGSNNMRRVRSNSCTD